MSTIDPRQSDPLDELFARESDLRDDGFTGRVLESLPPERQKLRTPILAGFAAASGALGLVLLIVGPGSALPQALIQLSSGPAVFGAGLTLAALAASAVYASLEEA